MDVSHCDVNESKKVEKKMHLFSSYHGHGVKSWARGWEKGCEFFRLSSSRQVVWSYTTEKKFERLFSPNLMHALGIKRFSPCLYLTSVFTVELYGGLENTSFLGRDTLNVVIAQISNFSKFYEHCHAPSHVALSFSK